jgi:hypothetical protein
VAIRLLVERTTNLQAVVSTRSLRVVAPQFRAAEVIITRPVYSALVAYPLYQTTVNYRRLVNSIYFRDLQTSELILDADTKNRYFRDTDAVSFLDALSLAFERPLSNLAYLTEQAAIAYGKNVDGDALFTSDLVHVLLIIQREFFDSVSVIEDQTLLSVGKLTQDVLGPSDQITSRQVEKGLSTPATMQDTGAVLSFFKDALDDISVADTYSAAISYARNFFEEVTAVSDVRPIFDLNLGPAEELLPVDSLAYLLETFAADEAFITDEPSIDYGRPESDTLATDDLFERIVVYSRAFDDAFSLDDSTTLDGVIKDTYAVKTNVFGFSDESIFDFLKAADDVVEMTDSFSYSAASSLEDTFVMNESLVVAKRSVASSVLNIGAFNSAPFNN